MNHHIDKRVDISDAELRAIAQRIRAIAAASSFDHTCYAADKTFVTMIGTRSTTQPESLEMHRLARRIIERSRDLGETVVIRSGHADGADIAAETGATAVGGAIEIHHPYRRPGSDLPGHYVFEYGELRQTVMDLVSRLHPAWDRCSEAARLLHTRNFRQVYGMDGITPSSLVICCATPREHGRVAGGTGMAVDLARIAEQLGCSAPIPVFNLRVREHRRELGMTLNARWPILGLEQRHQSMGSLPRDQGDGTFDRGEQRRSCNDSLGRSR